MSRIIWGVANERFSAASRVRAPHKGPGEGESRQRKRTTNERCRSPSAFGFDRPDMLRSRAQRTRCFLRLSTTPSISTGDGLGETLATNADNLSASVVGASAEELILETTPEDRR